MSSNFIDSKEVMKRFGFAKQSVRHFIPKFEALGIKPIRVGGKNVWQESEIEDVRRKLITKEIIF